jgi:hypothetical protein
MADQYKLSVGVLPLVGGTAGHLVIAATDPSGNVIFEAQGLATDSKGNWKPIGGPLGLRRHSNFLQAAIRSLDTSADFELSAA